jgi:hypothetical protein
LEEVQARMELLEDKLKAARLESDRLTMLHYEQIGQKEVIKSRAAALTSEAELTFANCSALLSTADPKVKTAVLQMITSLALQIQPVLNANSQDATVPIDIEEDQDDSTWTEASIPLVNTTAHRMAVNAAVFTKRKAEEQLAPPDDDLDDLEFPPTEEADHPVEQASAPSYFVVPFGPMKSPAKTPRDAAAPYNPGDAFPTLAAAAEAKTSLNKLKAKAKSKISTMTGAAKI